MQRLSATMTAAMGSSTLYVADGIDLDAEEIEEVFVRASGPGGQNVNKTSTAVQVKFNVRASRSLPAWLRDRLERIAGRRLSSDGVLVITAQRFRSQARNREDARERLVSLIRQAARTEKPRRATKPTHASKVRRGEAKRRRATVKRLRRAPGREEG